MLSHCNITSNKLTMDLSGIKKFYIISFLGTFLFWFVNNSHHEYQPFLKMTLYPLIFCYLVTSVYLNILIKHNLNKALKYTLAISIFFSITLSSLFGATESLTGSHVISPNLYLYGLSFYSAFLAYLIYENSISRNIFLLASNPLLLITGPIPYYFKNISYKSFTSRINYYFPYLIIGIFFVKVISIPLTHFLWMLELQDILSAIFFAFIFEIFIYFNFAGLSLIIYSL